MPAKKKIGLDEAELKREKKSRKPNICVRCLANGVPEEKVTFLSPHEYLSHMRGHAKKDRETVKTRSTVAPAAQPRPIESRPITAIEEPTTIEPDIEPIGELDWDDLETPLDEAKVLRRVLKDAGLIARVDAITRHFMNHSNLDDVAFLDSLLRGAGASVPVTKWALLGWADHRRGGHDWVNAKYPEQALTFETAEKIAEKKAAEQPKEEESPFKAMKNFFKEQIEMRQSMMMMDYMDKLSAKGLFMTPTGQTVDLNKKPEEEAKLRAVEGGQFVKMTEAEFADYLMRQQQFGLQKEKMEQDSKVRLAQDEKKKESEKIPLRLDDGQIVNVPADQIDKYLFLMKSMAPDQKKDIYELMREQEKTRSEMEKHYQQQMQELRDQNLRMMTDRQEGMIKQLQAQMASRPNPIMEMVQTQEELKQAGLMKQEGESIDQHKMVLQEKKLDTTMSLMIQQQASLNRKTDQALGLLAPIAQKFAQEAAEDLPRPKEFREKGLARRKQRAQEILPIPEQQMEQMQEQLEHPPEEIPEQEPRRKKAMTVGRAQ